MASARGGSVIRLSSPLNSMTRSAELSTVGQAGSVDNHISVDLGVALPHDLIRFDAADAVADDKRPGKGRRAEDAFAKH